MDNAIPERDRRKKETGFIAHILETLTGKQSRKVAFGIWVFAVSTTLLKDALIAADIWWNCVLLCGALIGLGTVLDETIAKFGDLIAVFSADKVKAVFSKKTETTTVTSETPPAQ